MIKRVGYCLYVHKSNIKELRTKLTDDMNIMLDSVIHCVEVELDVPYHIIKVDTKNQKISVIECFDWDKYEEPTVGNSYCFDCNTMRYSMKKGGTKVYHHKWMFVSDDYKGFNLRSNRTRTDLLNTIPEFVNNKSRIGNLDYWLEFLKKYGLHR